MWGKKKSNTAHWVQHTHLFRPDEYECSRCCSMSQKPYSVCPACDADMISSKYDPSWVDEMEFMDMLFSD